MNTEIKDKRIFTAIMFILITAILTYFIFFLNKYNDYFLEIEKQKESIKIEKNKEIKEVVFTGFIDVTKINNDIGPNYLLNKYNILLKNGNYNNANFAYIKKSDLQEYFDKLMINNFKFLVCFSQQFEESCLFYKQLNNETRIEDELSLYFLLGNKEHFPSKKGFQERLNYDNNISVLTKLGLSLDKDSILTEDTFYTKKSLFEKKIFEEKSNGEIIGYGIGLLVFIFCFMFTLIHYFNERDYSDDDIIVTRIITIVLFGLLIFLNPFLFLM